MIVLDTDHLSVLQRSNSTHASQLRERLIAVTNESVVATIISYEEQVRSWLSQIGRHSDVVEQVPFYDHLIRFVEFFSVWELLPFSEEAAR